MRYINIKDDPKILNDYKVTIPILCDYCDRSFDAKIKYITRSFKRYPKQKSMFCCKKCTGLAQIIIDKVREFECTHCGKTFERYYHPEYLEQNKNKFCNSSCAATYNNRNKKYGTRRSKFERWLEEELTDLLPDMEVIYNSRSVIRFELDLYLPELGLAFEINGIHHYKAIFGQKKLLDIQRNDRLKLEQCTAIGIELHTIDISGMKKFSPEWSRMYLQPVLDILGGA